jgi:hypothetical protein
MNSNPTNDLATQYRQLYAQLPSFARPEFVKDTTLDAITSINVALSEETLDEIVKWTSGIIFLDVFMPEPREINTQLLWVLAQMLVLRDESQSKMAVCFYKVI